MTIGLKGVIPSSTNPANPNSDNVLNHWPFQKCNWEKRRIWMRQILGLFDYPKRNSKVEMKKKIKDELTYKIIGCARKHRI